MMNSPYPIYPNYQPMPYMPNMMPGIPMMNTNDQTSNLQEQINMLDRRVSKLESMSNSTTTYNTTYNDGNYHMM